MNRAGLLVILLAASGCSSHVAESAELPKSQPIARIPQRESARKPADDAGPTELTAEENARIDALPPPIVGLYCAGKLHSGGCLPGLEWTGLPSLTSRDPFVVRATRLKPDVSAFVCYGSEALQSPYQGGFRCVGGTIHRLTAQDSGGSGACGGAIEYDFSALLRSRTDPALVVGAKVFVQVEFRDDSDPAGFGTGSTGALQFIIQP